MSEEKATIDERSLANQLRINVTDVHINTSQQMIITTRDKLDLCLLRRVQYIGKKNAWVTPLGILLTIIITFGTTTFTDIGLSAYTWQAIFIIAGILTFVWLLWCIYQAMKAKKVDIVKELTGRTELSHEHNVGD